MTQPLSSNQIETIVEETIRRVYADLVKTSPAAYSVLQQLAMHLTTNEGFATTVINEFASCVRTSEQTLTEEQRAAVCQNIGALFGKHLFAVGGKSVLEGNVLDPVFTRVQSTGPGSDVTNVAIGEHALMKNEQGSHNTAVGKGALAGATKAHASVAIGAGAMIGAVGDFNTVVGADAMRQKHGDRNTAIGADALSSATQGNDNVALGVGAGMDVFSGSGNTLVGATTTVDGRHSLARGEVNDTAAVGSTRTQQALIAVGWSTLVDDESKEEITQLQGSDCLDFINLSKPVSWVQAGTPNQKRYGFTASALHHFQSAGVPLLNHVGGRDFLQESHLTPILVAAVRELSNKVSELEREVRSLKPSTEDN